MEDHKICSIILPENDFSDKYTFYKNGKIERVRLEEGKKKERITKEQISTRNKDRLIRLCPENDKEKVMLVLDYP